MLFETCCSDEPCLFRLICSRGREPFLGDFIKEKKNFLKLSIMSDTTAPCHHELDFIHGLYSGVHFLVNFLVDLNEIWYAVMPFC